MPRKTNADYESNDGFSTAIWGPPMWHILRTISFNYPVNPTQAQKEGYRTHLLSLKYVLPCGACRRNYEKNLKAAKFSNRVFKNRHTFARFMYRLEQNVHKMTTGEAKLPVSFQQRRAQYECFRAKCAKSKRGEEKGCIVPKNYVKSVCSVNVVPCSEAKNAKSFSIDPNCLLEHPESWFKRK